jgi:prepilin-type processing-associated H-X9-DG protein
VSRSRARALPSLGPPRSEPERNPAAYYTGTDGADNETMYSGSDNDNQHCTYWPPMQDRRGFSDTERFGSAHTGVYNMLMCDGSVQSVDYYIDAAVFRATGSRF